jgi:hypothetical protein
MEYSDRGLKQHFDFHLPDAAQLAVSGAYSEADEAMVLA